jgi:hypothetical protein
MSNVVLSIDLEHVTGGYRFTTWAVCNDGAVETVPPGKNNLRGYCRGHKGVDHQVFPEILPNQRTR